MMVKALLITGNTKTVISQYVGELYWISTE
jgi:hypothetical protein